METSKPTKPSRFKVDIWVEGGGYDVTVLNKGEPGLKYHVRVRSRRAPSKKIDIKSIALVSGSASTPLVVFASASPLEWICSLESSRAKPGTDNHDVAVDPNTAGSSTLQAIELVLSDPLGPPTTEVVNVHLPLTVV